MTINTESYEIPMKVVINHGLVPVEDYLRIPIANKETKKAGVTIKDLLNLSIKDLKRRKNIAHSRIVKNKYEEIIVLLRKASSIMIP